jgi:hypothetical protein
VYLVTWSDNNLLIIIIIIINCDMRIAFDLNFIYPQFEVIWRECVMIEFDCNITFMDKAEATG